MSRKPDTASGIETLEHVHGPDCGHDHGPPPAPFVRDTPKQGRNDPCACGSGRKYKKCHGAATSRV